MKHLFNSNLRNPALIYIMICAGLTGIFPFTMAQDSPWTRKAGMPNGRHSHATSVVDGMIYVTGGRYTQKLVAAYDPTSEIWTTKAYMLKSRMIHSCCVVNGKIYAIGGLAAAYQPALNTIEEYDPVKDSWTLKKNMPTNRLGLCTSVVDGKIYVIGGMTSGSNFWSGMHDTVEVYDPETDSWSAKTSMPTGRVWFTTSVVDGKIYAIGGCLVNKQEINTVEMYDPVTDTWTTKSPMPTARAGHVASVVDGIIYIIGGGTVSADPGGYAVVEAYDPATDTWTRKADIPIKRAGACASMLEEKIYVIGGIITFADPHLHGENTVYAYDPSNDLTKLINQLNLEKCYLAPESEICFSAKMNDTTGITLQVMIESPDQNCIDTLQLFDDGNHNDKNAGDSIYSNTWYTSSEEVHYYVDLKVKQEYEDTITHRINNAALFTTIGPVVLESSSDLKSSVKRDKWIALKCTLANKGLTSTAHGIKAKITSHDTSAIVTSDLYYSFGDISPGESVTGSALITITESCPGNTPIPMSIDITSNGYSYWSDTFSIVIPSATMTEKNTLQQSDLIQNYPNPCDALTTISFNLNKSDHVSLKVYNSLGKEVKTLVDNILEPGDHEIIFNTGNLEAGMYIYTLKTGNMASTKKMVIIH